MRDLTDAHRELLDASREIGGVVESAAWASHEVATLIEATGKRIDELTVGELRALLAQRASRMIQPDPLNQENAMNAPDAVATPALPGDIEPGTPFAGGLFCLRLFEGASPYALIVSTAEGDLDPLTFAQAPQKAAAARIGGHEDWQIPNRAEALAMAEHLEPKLRGTADALQRRAYWTSAQRESGSVYAWCQSFDWGTQYNDLKSDELRVRLVRRVAI